MPFLRTIRAEPLDGFRLRLAFEDGVEGVVDLSPLAGRGVFAAWNQPGVFEQVTVAADGSLEWEGGLDLCADALYQRITGQLPEAFGARTPEAADA